MSSVKSAMRCSVSVGRCPPRPPKLITPYRRPSTRLATAARPSPARIALRISVAPSLPQVRATTTHSRDCQVWLPAPRALAVLLQRGRPTRSSSSGHRQLERPAGTERST
jgi:hypothetical protein